MVGTTVSHFTIERELGKGGMGVVYLASDTELKRPVALKFLGLESAIDQVTMERFQREAQAAAALNHPNIVTIYEFGESAGQRYIAMEYVEGESLRTKVAGGEIPVDEACRIARQMCEGLEAAHAHGIVHRDIKPENVMVLGDGRVKVLDFGIAKLRGSRPITREATVGTAWYMSPEQLRGEQVDHRTDIWAAGIVLYEMLSGFPPFRGEYDSAVTYGIVNEDPVPIRDLRADVPVAVADAIHRALEKNPERRFEHIADFAAALGPEPVPAPPRPDSRFRSRVSWIAGAAVLVLAVAVAAVTILRSERGGSFSLAGARPQQVTYIGDVGDFDLSPDGGFLAFVAPTADGQQMLVVRDLSGSSVVPLDTGRTIASPVWSPDGGTIAAGVIRDDSTAGVYLIPRLGGPERRVFHAFVPLLSWSIDGTQLAMAAYGGFRVGVVKIETGDSAGLTIPPEVGTVTALNPRFTAAEIAVSSVEPQGTSIWKLSLAGAKPVRFFHEPSSNGYFVVGPQYVPAVERLFFLRRHTTSQTATLLALRIGRGDVPEGEPEALTETPRMVSGFRLTSDARTVVYRNDLSYSNLWLAFREGGRWVSKQITEGTNRKSRGRFSPDGSSIVFTMADGPGYNLYITGNPAAAGAAAKPAGLQRLTSLTAATWSPAWSPDGTQIVFASDQGGGFRLWTVAVSGGRQRKLEAALALPGFDAVIWAPSPRILFPSQPHGEYKSVDPTSGSVAPAPGSEPAVVLTHPVVSPDGRRLAGLRLSRVTGAAELSVFDGNRWHVFPVSEGSAPIGWTPDGQQLLVLASRTGVVSAVRISDGRTTTYAELPFLDPDPRMVDVNREATAFLYTKREPVRDLWMLRSGKDAE